MLIKELCQKMAEQFPLENAMSYDNVGLLVGDDEVEITGVVLTLDCTSSAVSYAKSVGANLIISHHPLIFGGINNVLTSDPNGRIITSLIKNDISLYAAHTNLDITDDFGNRAIAETLEGINIEHLDGTECGVVFDLESNKSMTVKEFCAYSCDKLSSSGVITISDQQRVVRKVFAQGGAFDEDSIPAILEGGIDTVVSGEIKHHICVLLEEYGISSIILGHSATEQIYLPKLKECLEKTTSNVKYFVHFNNEKKLN